jgi:hypothetical protein
MALVRNVITRRVLPCCWDDCERPGRTEYELRVPDADSDGRPKTLIYVFCSLGHRAFYIVSFRARLYGKLTTGEKGPLM